MQYCNPVCSHFHSSKAKFQPCYSFCFVTFFNDSVLAGRNFSNYTTNRSDNTEIPTKIAVLYCHSNRNGPRWVKGSISVLCIIFWLDYSSTTPFLYQNTFRITRLKVARHQRITLYIIITHIYDSYKSRKSI